MQFRTYHAIGLHLQRGDETVELYWRKFYEDKNTYAVQFVLGFDDITIDCLYGFTDGFSYSLLVNTDPITRGELHDKLIPVFMQIYENDHLINTV